MKGRISVADGKTHFEQVPIKVVKRLPLKAPVKPPVVRPPRAE